MPEISIDFTQDPIPILSKIRQSAPGSLHIRCPAPTCTAEENYLLLFEEFSPSFTFHSEKPFAAGPYDPQRLAIPTEPILPVTGLTHVKLHRGARVGQRWQQVEAWPADR
jgi:hypothetical protein